MSLIDKYIGKGIRFLLPAPFTIAILLTILFTLVVTKGEDHEWKIWQ